MTKRINAKHKIDRRLKVNLWGRPKSPFNTEHILQVNTVKTKEVNQQIMEFNLTQNKN